MFLSNVPSLFRITRFIALLSVNNILPLGQITHPLLLCAISFGIFRKCDDLMAIAELIKTAKTSSIIATMEQSLRDMRHNIDIAVKDREGNLSSIRKQRQHYSDEIKQIRVKINSHLDTIEQRIMGDLIEIVTLSMICGYTNWTANCVMYWAINRVFHIMVFAVMNNF
jgi:hypothetical protein